MHGTTGKKIFILPDAQVRPGVPTDHLLAAGKFIVDKKPDIVVVLGDWWDMPSLSSYEKAGTKSFEGRRYKDDCVVGNEAMKLLLSPLKRRKKGKPRMVFVLGNHEHRIERAIEADPAHLDGIIGYHDLDLSGWEVHGYQEIVDIEGVLFSHSFVNPDSLLKNVLGGNIDNKMQKIGSSFVMGHQQHLQFGTRSLSSGKQLIGIVAGSYYQHDEDYLGPQGNNHWRGCVMLNEVRDGYGDPMFLSLDYMLRRYG